MRPSSIVLDIEAPVKILFFYMHVHICQNGTVPSHNFFGGRGWSINPPLPIIWENKLKTTGQEKKSFVIIVSDFDFNKVSDKLTVVPTLQEAHDIIEMEEIERDLGL